MRTRTTPIRTRTPTTPSTTTASALARAIEPLDTGTFARLHWEREPLHRARGEEGRFDDLLSARDAERIVCDPGLRAPAFRLVKAGEQLDARAYTTDLGWRPQPFTGAARLERVLAEFERGATIVLQALHLNWRPVARFCRALEAELGHPAQANAYLTPRRSQGLPVHHDTHDVFVLQVSGSKRWLVYPPALELPLRDQRYSPSLGGADEAPTLDVEIGPGDTLYLPRGWLHQALTSDTDSLHLTIGVNAYTWYDALRAALERCTDEVALRRAVPLDGEGGPELLELLAGRLEPPAVAAAMRGRLVRTRRPIAEDDGLQRLRALDRLGPATLVERRPSVLAELAPGGGAATLVFEGKRIAFPTRLRGELKFLLGGSEPFAPSQLPGPLDEAGRLVLVRRLVSEGFLRLARSG